MKIKKSIEKKREKIGKRVKTRHIKYHFFVALALLLASFIVVAIADFQPYPKNFWILVFGISGAICLYYLIVSLKFIESFALFAAWFIMLAAGLSDFLMYAFMRVFINVPFPAELPHLFDEPLIGGFARWLGLSTVTPASLAGCIIFWGAIAACIIFFLKKLQRRVDNFLAKKHKNMKKLFAFKLFAFLSLFFLGDFLALFVRRSSKFYNLFWYFLCYL